MRKRNILTIGLLSTLCLIIMACNIRFKSTNNAEVIDVDGNAYKTVIIGDQEWMAEGLYVEHFNNGEAIKLVSNCEDWYSAGNNMEPACCYVDFDSNNYRYGLMYNWYAVNDTRGLAPKGYKIPSSADLEKLISENGGEDNAGYNLRSTSGWIEKQGNNSTEFNIEPVGCLTGKHDNKECLQDYVGEYTCIWSSTPVNAHFENKNLRSYGYFLQLNGWDGNAQLMSNPYEHTGHFVRCIKN